MTGDADLGSLRTGPDGAVLRFERRYDHPIERVWRAVTEPEHQAVWFPQQILGHRASGARLRFVTSVDPDEGFEGTMLAFEPPRLVEMLWGESRLRIELTPMGTGTVLVLTEVLPDIGAGARNGAGWHECLARLGAIVGDTVPEPWGEGWNLVHPRYVEAFGAEGSRLGAPEGWADDLPDDPYAPRFPQHPDPLAALKDHLDDQ